MIQPPGSTSRLGFAIVVPTYNEAADIGATCEALLKLTPGPDEVIFVDGASTDDTANVIRRHLVRPSIRLIVQDSKRGIASARNVGVRAATSEVVVFVDADVHLPSDFLGRISRHYEQGADAVAVEAEVPNTASSVVGRFLQAYHEYLYGGDQPVEWSQAFSCRRSAALDAGLFGEMLPGGAEDMEFVRRLITRTSKRITDKTIVVEHVTPTTMGDFWRQWEHRGWSLPFLRHRVQHVRWPWLIAERMAASLWSFVLVITVLPVARQAIALASLSDQRWSDLPSFLGLRVLQLLAHRMGEWKGMVHMALSRPSDAR